MQGSYGIQDPLWSLAAIGFESLVNTGAGLSQLITPWMNPILRKRNAPSVVFVE